MKLKDLENIMFPEDLKVCVHGVKFNEGYEWNDVKFLKDAFWGWDYDVVMFTKSANYDIVIHVKPHFMVAK